MAFVNQIVPSQFVNQRLKSLRVLCQERVNEFGDLAIPLAGVDVALLDQVQATITAVGTPVIQVLEAVPNKVVNIGYVPVTLSIVVAEIINLVDITVNVPFQGVVECPGVLPGDNIQKHDIQVLGVVDTPITQYAVVGGVLVPTVALLLKAVVELCIVVGREEILKINAAPTFC